MSLDPIKNIEKLTEQTNTFMGKHTRGALERYPLLFSFLVVFGVVSVLHGFELIIEEILFLQERPFLIFGAGVLILIFTGSLYKRLDKKIE